jgi:hypothetical protein
MNQILIGKGEHMEGYINEANPDRTRLWRNFGFDLF